VEEINFVMKFVMGGARLEGGSGEFRSFRVCLEGDD